jgi:hypothetical protein
MKRKPKIPVKRTPMPEGYDCVKTKIVPPNVLTGIDSYITFGNPRDIIKDVSKSLSLPIFEFHEIHSSIGSYKNL